jgi:hypothetical protein
MTTVKTPPILPVEQRPNRYKLIACDVLGRELSACVATCRPIVDVHFLPKGLHDLGAEPMGARLQEAIDQTEPCRYDAILLGYGLCNNGTLGLRAPVPMVIPRAHDCISLLLGSRNAYQAHFERNPGTYFLSPGWVERVSDLAKDPESIPSQLGMNRTYDEYVNRFGEENARYLVETLGGWLKQYRKLAYIETGVGDSRPYKDWARTQATERGWEYEELEGSNDLLLRLTSGTWDIADFLMIPAGQTIAASYDEGIVKCASC